MRDKQIEDLKDYKYGFSTDIESFKAPKAVSYTHLTLPTNHPV